jgi:hypothetical protein
MLAAVEFDVSAAFASVEDATNPIEANDNTSANSLFIPLSFRKII